MAQLRKRPEKENPVHIISEKRNGNYIIKRLKHPLIEILYHPESKTGEPLTYSTGTLPELQARSITGELFTYSGIANKKFTKDDINAAVKKAIAWAKHNIK